MSEKIIEQEIITAVRKLLTDKANDFLGKIEYLIPLIEFSDYGGSAPPAEAVAVVPTLALSSCEMAEKERIVRIAAYNLTISFTVPEHADSELHSYIYAWAVCRALEQNPTLYGVADRAVVSNKKFVPPKKPSFGQGWEVDLSLRITVEEIGNGC